MSLVKSVIMLSVWTIIFLIVLLNLTNLFNAKEKLSSSTYSNQTHKLLMTDENRHLIWFLQISDIHISAYEDQTRITDFREFCENTVKVFKPSVVIASGDITDGRTSDHFGTQQIREEWTAYWDILSSLNVSQHTEWLDVRGNHDTFNVLNVKSNENYFADYSMQGKTNSRSYLYQLNKDGQIYSFIAIDLTLQPGPRFPFNFVGKLDSAEERVINDLANKVESGQYTIWFGHYPTSCVLKPNKIRSLIAKRTDGMVYLCGHLHNIVPRMYTIQDEGFLELELSDWKNNRMYRLLAVDHGLLSFIDIKHQDWPVVLITNPKHALFITHNRENVDIIKRSTHVRVLIFSADQIDFAEVQIDNEEWMPLRHVEGPLYVAAWDPNMYKIGLHTVKVHVQDLHGRSKYHAQPFSLDGTQLSFGYLGTFFLKSSAHTIYKSLFWTLSVLILTLLLVLKLMHFVNIKSSSGEKKKIDTSGGTGSCFRKLWILSSVNKIFWPLVVYQIYVMIGPWCFGYLIENKLGAVFSWGIFVDGTFLPGSFTYIYGFIQSLVFQIPIIFILAHTLDYRIQVFFKSRSVEWSAKMWIYGTFVPIATFQLGMAFFYLIAYGLLACSLCLHTWTVFFAIILFLRSYNFQVHHEL